MGRSRKRLEMQNRDRNLLMGLWRWKLLTTTAIWAEFYPNSSLEYVYQRLLKLTRYGLVTSQPDELFTGWYWSLDKQGFRTIQEGIEGLREVGFRSEHQSHDSLTSAIHLCAQRQFGLKPEQITTEQELRRLSDDVLHPFLPNPLEHRPDGYFQNPSTEECLSLEVELHIKTKGCYQAVTRFYERNLHTLKHVLWIVPGPTLATRITNYLIHGMGQLECRHWFASAKALVSDGWSAPVISLNQKPITIPELFEKVGLTSGSHPAHPCEISLFLENSKTAKGFRGFGSYSETQKRATDPHLGVTSNDSPQIKGTRP